MKDMVSGMELRDLAKTPQGPSQNPRYLSNPHASYVALFFFFALAISLALFELHNVQVNPAYTFNLLTANRGVYRQTASSYYWDDPPNCQDQSVYESLLALGGA